MGSPRWTEQLTSLLSQRSAAEQELMMAQAEQVGLAARINAAGGGIDSPEEEGKDDTKKGTAPVKVPTDQEVDAYRLVLATIDSLNAEWIQLLGKYTESNAQVVSNRSRLACAEAKRNAMLAGNPGLGRAALGFAGSPGAPLGNRVWRTREPWWNRSMRR